MFEEKRFAQLQLEAWQTAIISNTLMNVKEVGLFIKMHLHVVYVWFTCMVNKKNLHTYIY